MKIVLVNDNPVVKKLVTLSAQKTGDEVVNFENMEAVNETSCELLIVDDVVFDGEKFNLLSEKLNFTSSLIIAPKNYELPEGITKLLNKPFLPTELVELFNTISTPVDDIEETLNEEDMIVDDHFDDIPDEPLEEIGDEKELDLDDLEDDDEEELSLDDLFDEEDEESDGILDKEDVEEVQNLLDEDEEEELDLGDLLDENEDEELDLGDLEEEEEEELDLGDLEEEEEEELDLGDLEEEEEEE
ncbi:MAG: hypothetical protein GQ570_09570, partial [Helicobacteraceae bacterium]|nr:hypothetical protein [Helicobacteraceae bacterium]